jgi:hypothetical protein
LVFYNEVTIYQTQKILVLQNPNLLLSLPTCCRCPGLLIHELQNSQIWDLFLPQSVLATVLLSVTPNIFWRDSFSLESTDNIELHLKMNFIFGQSLSLSKHGKGPS